MQRQALLLVAIAGCVHGRGAESRAEAGERTRSDAALRESGGTSADLELQRQPACGYLLDLRPPPSDVGQVRSDCIPLFVRIAASGEGRAADAAHLLVSYCGALESLMEVQCAASRSPACEDDLARIEAAGPSCDRQRGRGAELLQKARETDARLAPYLREADRLIELRRVRCEAQNRGTHCRDLKWQLKEHSSPPRPEGPAELMGVTPDETICVVAPRAKCPSTTANDRETKALTEAFQLNFPHIDDPDRRRSACRAWQNAVLFCDRASLEPSSVLDAGADATR